MSDSPTPPVFYDPQQQRWRRFKRISQIIGAVLSIIFGVLIVSVLFNPVLPVLGLPAARALPQSHHLAPPQPRRFPTTRPERGYQQSKRRLSDYLAGKKRAVASTPPAPATPVPHGKTEAIGFYVNWDDTSFTSLKQNAGQLDKLIPEWLHLTAADGTISVDDPDKTEQALAWLREHRPDLRIVPLVNNFRSETMEWERDKLATMLADPTARSRAIQQLLTFVRAHNFAGISIDFENVPPASQADLKKFQQELWNQFHPLGLEVSQSVPLDDSSFDYRGLAQVNDYLILMAYDEHESSSDAGPVAAQSWYADALKKRFAELPADKYVISVGNYGYDWTEKTKPATEISFQEALTIAQDSTDPQTRNEKLITLDAASLNPTFSYEDEKDAVHHVWFLNAVTTFNQMVEGNRYSPRGYALWRLGSEDPSVWSVFERRSSLDSAAADAVRTLHYGYDIDYEGEGEVLHVKATPHDGRRAITFDQQTGLINAESLTESDFPSPYVIERRGAASKKKIALTFDDGPDARFTPQVLDVLKQYHVPATFFIVGLNGDLNPDLLKRIDREGHEIGNHTFTHPNASVISEQQLRLELNVTERLLESSIGRRTLLFRPPYAEDAEPETPDQVKPLLFTSDKGYYTIGMQIDPNDWRTPGVEQIIKATIDGAVNGEGNVVLLHDSGGDRSQTVRALPQIIEGLRARGFELVTVSDLMGLSRDAVMPPIPRDERFSAKVNDAGFLLINWISATINYLFLAGIMLGLMRLLFIGVLAISEWWMSRHTTWPTDYRPKVSVIVPAWNEEKVINKTIQSLLESDYPNFDIIVVDDGSQDQTYQRVLDVSGQHPQVRAFTKPNGGKAAALNYGISRTEAEIVIGLDADTIFRPDAISKLVRHFADQKTGAVAGNAKVGNRLNLLTRWQALEYITSQNLDRRAFDVLNCITVVPGAIGAWRRELIERAGGFTSETLAEDADLTLAIRRMGYDIAYEDEAIALTEAPDTVRGFVRQRYRWMFGTLQAAWKHLDTLFRPKYGALGSFAIPNVLVFQIFFPLISPVMDLLMLWSFSSTLWQRYQHPNEYSTDGLKRVLFYYTLFLLVDLLAALVAFLLEKKEDWRLLMWLLLQRFFYRQLMYYVAIKSTLAALRGSMVGWGRLERKATVRGSG